MNHALDAAQMVINYPSIPLGAEVLIKQHHGSTTGRGFVDRVSPSISPLAAVFITAEEFVKEILDRQGKKIDVNEIFDSLRGRLQGSQVKKALHLLASSFKS